MRALGAWLQQTAASHTIQSVSWLIPLLQSIHILMIGVVFVSSLMICLRVLGRARTDEPVSTVWHRFAPWLWVGLVLMAATGLTLVIGEPVREFTALSFWIKMTLVAVGVLSTAAYGRSLAGLTASGAALSLHARIGAVLMIALWLAIIFLGRAIAYDREVWGSLSPHA